MKCLGWCFYLVEKRSHNHLPRQSGIECVQYHDPTRRFFVFGPCLPYQAFPKELPTSSSWPWVCFGTPLEQKMAWPACNTRFGVWGAAETCISTGWETEEIHLLLGRKRSWYKERRRFCKGSEIVKMIWQLEIIIWKLLLHVAFAVFFLLQRTAFVCLQDSRHRWFDDFMETYLQNAALLRRNHLTMLP